MTGGRAFWDALASIDPLFAVLSDPSKAGRRWRLDDFMRVGEREIAKFELALARAGVELPRGRALDFGCAVGRISQALARRCTAVIGVDVSPVMISLADRINRYPDRVTYVLNSSSDLARFGDSSFDLIYSNIVLQHMPPHEALTFIGEFVRVLAPGGLLFFQVPSRPVTPRPGDAVRPMPPTAYRAAIRFLHAAPQAMTAGSTARISADVTNLGDCAWRRDEYGPVNVGNHWLDSDGVRVLVQDDARAPLPGTVNPGDRVVIDLTVTAPSTPGTYTLELDCVHERVTWFSHAARSRVVISATGEPVPAAPLLLNELPVPDYDDAWLGESSSPPLIDGLPVFPMFGVPRDEVIAAIARGGEIVSIEEDSAAGTDWESFRYLVRKPA